MNTTQILDKLRNSKTGLVTVKCYKGRAPGVGRVQGNNKIVETVMSMATRGMLRIVNDTQEVAKTNGYKITTRTVSYKIF